MPTADALTAAPAAARRVLAWLGVAFGGSATLDMARRMVALVAALTMAGCAVLPTYVERPVSHALGDGTGTKLARIAAQSTPEDARSLSGFRLLPDGAESFEARIALIRRAETSLDVQYYLIAGDATGREFMQALRDAADRGVRVRVLLDDLYATGRDAPLLEMARHPNVQVRMFNPLPVRSGGFVRRVLFSMHELSRINHRMHNKLFIADGSFAITGGRNIADEYFDRSGSTNFIDMDVISTGGVVQALEAVFDGFWNSDLAFPIGSLAARDSAGRLPDEPPDEAAPEGAIGTELDGGRIGLDYASAEVIADSPHKASGDKAAATVSQSHLALLVSARSSVVIASPYFVPGQPTMQAMSNLRSNGVSVSVLTNSLATTDEPLVHFGYARHRAALLDVGVDLHELMPASTAPEEPVISLGTSGGGSSLGRLHTKLTVVDQETVFVGSMNMDARSARLNTEACIVIHSAALSRVALRFLERRLHEGSYRLQRQNGHLSWASGAGEHGLSRSVEPATAASPTLPIRVLAQFLGDDFL